MSTTATKKLTKAKLVKFFEDYLKPYGEEVGTSWDGYPNVVVMTTNEAKKKYDYTGGKFHVIFESSWIYGAINYPETPEDWEFETLFTEFLKEHGMYYERGTNYNFNIYND